MLKPHPEATVPDCAICLDNIRPKHHAKAILACRHEFHLSCISMAFTMGKEMICPLCRFLHKDQPFMSPEEVSSKLPVPSSPNAVAAAAAVAASAAAIASSQTTPVNSATVSSGRNRHRNNSIHLQHNLSNLMQHQQRRRSTYDLRRASVTSLSSSSPPSPSTPVTPPVQDSPDSEGSILSRVSFFGATSHAQQQEQPPPAPSLSVPSSSAPLQPNAYLNMSTWFMLYGMPFSVAMLFLAFILGQVETLWSKVSCLIGSVICYMLCWALAVGFVLPVQECPASHISYGQDLASSTAATTVAATAATTVAATAAAAAAATAASTGEATPNSGTGSIASVVLDAVSGSLPHLPVSVSVSPTIPSSMAFEFELASDLGLDTATPSTPSSSSPSRSTSVSTYPFQYIFQIRDQQQQQQQQQQHQRQQQLQQLQELQQQQELQQRQSGLEVESIEEVLVSSLTMFSWLTPGASSLSRWMMANQYAKDLQRRISDLADVLDDYSESFGGW
ncbi:MAG: hypothetical protein J3R72DRAFT_495129 [Linnemannia gamsii]|nr:MAG: hypothetical protein J3R72DRAFT_495129 [Linnemannia gamsii]